MIKDEITQNRATAKTDYPQWNIRIFDAKKDNFQAIADATDILPHCRQRWPAELEKGAINLVVAYSGNKPIGRAILRWPNGTKTTPPILNGLPTVQAVRVNNTYRGKGCGTKIMLACEDLLRAHPDQPQKLALTVRIINKEGQALYDNLGYKTVDQRWEKLYEKDANGKIIEYPARCFCMVKDLTAG